MVNLRYCGLVALTRAERKDDASRGYCGIASVAEEARSPQ